MACNPDELITFATALLTSEGLDARSSALVAEHLIEANLKGHDSHGVGMLPQYVSSMRRGAAAKRGVGTVVVDRGPIIAINADRAFGQPVLYDALESVSAKAREHGIGLLTVRRAHHIGRVGAYAERLAEQGLVSVSFANINDHPPLVAPFGGSDARSSTNPIAIGFPAHGASSSDPPRIVHDFATSFWPLGKARVAWSRGESAPPGALIDASGRPTTDPGVMFPGCKPGGAYIQKDQKMGALRAFGEHKGAGLNFACELMGALAGGGTAADDSPHNLTADRRQCAINNIVVLVIDPNAVAAPQFVEEVRAMAAFWRGSAAAAADASEGTAAAKSWGRVLLPGEAETLTAAERAVEGIAIEESTFQALTALAEEHRIAVPTRRPLRPKASAAFPKAAVRAQLGNGWTVEATRVLAIVTAATAVFALGVAVGSRRPAF